MVTGPTILVVDDDEAILVLMRRLLRQSGFNPLTASSGVEALQHLLTSPPDLVLLDLSLEDVDGEQFMDQVREQGRRIPVLIVSGRNLSEDEIRTIGAVGALQKPFEVADLIRSIHRSLDLVRC